jgi:4-carboxymuconolactone decarboxylase
MTDVREQGLQVFRELLPGAVPDDNLRDGKFGDELLEIGIDNVFGRLWGRDGLSRRDRSLVTLGILIALRATDELKFHVQIARNNGLTEDEIAEVIYHASGYAGFPCRQHRMSDRAGDARPRFVIATDGATWGNRTPDLCITRPALVRP